MSSRVRAYACMRVMAIVRQQRTCGACRHVSIKGVAMTQALTRPAEFFDDKYGMDATSLQRVLGKMLGKQIDYADLYFQYEVSDAVSLEEGLVKQASKH